MGYGYACHSVIGFCIKFDYLFSMGNWLIAYESLSTEQKVNFFSWELEKKILKTLFALCLE